MGHQLQHYKALMRKNWISWKRTLLASCCELLCPVVLMIILLLARFAVKKESFGQQSFLSQSAIFYPLVNYSSSTNQTLAMMSQQNLLSGFYNFSQLDQSTQTPLTGFLPKNCLKQKTYAARPIVAFGPNNTLTWKVISELQLLVAQQKSYYQAVNATPQGQALLKGISPSSLYIDYQFKMFKDQNDILNYATDVNYNKDDAHPGICFGISMNYQSNVSYDVKLIFDDREEFDKYGVASQQKAAYNNYQITPDAEDFQSYSQYGFSFLQNWIANEVLRDATNITNASIVLSGVPMAEAAYVQDNFTQVISSMFPFFILLMYIIPMYRFIQRIVSEKQSRARESMRMMGLTDFSYWMSWFTFYFIVITIISILCTIIVSINVIKHSNKGLVFLFFWVFGMSNFGMIVFFQSLFSSPRVAAIFGTLVYFGTSFISSSVTGSAVSESSKNAASLLGTIGVYLGAINFGQYEAGNIGLNSQNAGELYLNYRFQSCLIFETIGFAMILTIGLYLDNVFPSEYGVKKPFYFFLLPSFWCGCKRSKKQRIDNHESMSANQDLETLREFETKYVNPEYYEPVSSDMKALEEKQKYLKIEELRKVFSNGFKAVNGLNVKMYNGQIFALLGHNGAGKSTTISMLTGLIQSTTGGAEVFGHDLFNEMDKVRSFLGVCPQHDILFDLLTPEEHLAIFCDFKGVDKKLQEAEIQKMLRDADLMQHRKTMAKDLSGGNRRKLSVGIALIGGSRLILLDEPTAGMDLSARRKLWNMLKGYKHNRIIILTTHYMDEADILGDRIGIMAGGQLICLGSSLFLKNRFGVGYNLTMVKKSKEPNTKVGIYFEQHLGPVKKLHEVSSEITYQIPTNLSHKFKEFFEDFDQSLDKLDLRSYGISITTLEEVFLRVGHLGQESKDDTISPSKAIEALIGNEKKTKKDHSPADISQQEIDADFDLDNFCIAEQTDQNGLKLFFVHLAAVFRKRYCNYRRNFKGLLVEILIPILLVIIGFILAKVSFYKSSSERLLTPSLYPLKQRILVNTDLMKTSNFDISPMQLIQNLPDFGNAFDVTYKNYTSINQTGGLSATLRAFDQDVFQQRYQGNSVPNRYGSYFIYEANNQTKQFKVSNFMNLTSQDVTALFPQFMYEAIIKTATGNPQIKFNVINAPFPITQRLKDQQANISGYFVVFVLAIGFALIPASIISYILNEREKNLKHMQLISGMNLSAYWVSNYIFDIIKAMIPSVIVIGLIYAFKLDFKDVWTVFLMYPIGVVPFTYAMSFLFSNENLAQTVTIFLHFVFSGIGAIVVLILRLITSTWKIGDTLMWVLRIIPSYCLTDSIIFSTGGAQLKQLRPTLNVENFNIQNMEGDLLLLGLHFIVWTLVLIMIETGFIARIWHAFQCNKKTVDPRQNLVMDDDVIEEENRVEQASPNDMKVRVNKFRKVYKTAFRNPLVAVERTSFGLDYGECFALLGVNGAGKSTTFKSLTGDIDATSGQITIGGMDIQRDFAQVRRQIGYCPQHDAIFDLMTVEEHLDYYASIKGITGLRKKAIVEKQIREMNLEIHRKKPAGTLSGGNKRKLSVAMAVLGNPPIILLDEPSAGMDPEARRFMWDVVARISQERKQSAVILTTHSMEEAEALSTKMGIMVRGGIFRCFGSSQHIKNKFGTGYEIEVKIRKLKSAEIQTKASSYLLPTDTEQIPFKQCTDLMRTHGIDEFLIGELREGGLGADIYNEAKEQAGMVTLKNFIIWLNVEIFGQIIIKDLVDNFQQVELLEHYNDYYKLRVPKQQKSIGYIFGMIEAKKEMFGISEYSVSQTTLEQIFQTFALLEVDATKGILFEKLPNGQIGRRLADPRSNSINGSGRLSIANSAVNTQNDGKVKQSREAKKKYTDQ